MTSSTTPSNRPEPPRRPPRLREVDRRRLPRPTPAAPAVLAVSLPGSGRSVWLRQVLSSFGGPVVSGPFPDSPGATFHLVGSGRIGSELAASADPDDLASSGLAAARRWPGAVLVGVDDAHLMPTDLVKWSETYLEEFLRSGGLLAATFGRTPSLSVARGVVGGWLWVLDDDDLAFTVEELAELAGLDSEAPADVLAELVQLRDATAGWATAAGAIARVLRRGGPPSDELLAQFAARLADLVLADLDEDDHGALLTASLLPSSSTALVEAVRDPDTARRFANLRLHHPALSARADNPEWSTVHPLLARGLRPRVDAASGPLAGDTLARAAAWHRSEGHLSEPVELLLAAHRWTEATALLVQSSLRFAEEARHQELLDLWAEIPPAAWEDDPVAVLTLTLLRTGAGQAQSAFDLLFRPPLTDFDLPAGTRAVADAIHGFLAPWSPDPASTLAAAERALDALADIDQSTIAPVTGMRAAGPWRHLAHLGAARAEIVLGRWPAASRRLGALAEDDTLGPLVRINQVASHARALALCGRLEAATEQASVAIAHARRRGVSHHPALVDAHLALAKVAFWRNDLQAADQAATEAAQRACRNGCPTQAAAAKAIRAGVALRLGQPEQALAQIDGVEGLPDGHPRNTVEAVRVRALHRTGAIADAQRLAAMLPLGPETALARAEVQDERELELADWHPDEEPASQVLGPLARAVSRHRAGADDAWTHLVVALDHAEPHGLLGPFAELPAALAITLAALPSGSAFAAAAVAAAQREVPLAGDAPLLTPTEINVLTALTSPLPLRDLAEQLFVSTNTLKSHLRRIYRKLGVASRADAVAVARRLGLT